MNVAELMTWLTSVGLLQGVLLVVPREMSSDTLFFVSPVYGSDSAGSEQVARGGLTVSSALPAHLRPHMQMDSRLSVDSLDQLPDMLLLGLALLARVDFPPILLATLQSLTDEARPVVKLVLSMTQTPAGIQNGVIYQLATPHALFLAGTGCFALPLIPNLAPQWRGSLGSFALGPLWAVASQLLWLFLVLKRRLPEFRLQNLLPTSFLMFVNQFLKVSALTFFHCWRVSGWAQVVRSASSVVPAHAWIGSLCSLH